MGEALIARRGGSVKVGQVYISTKNNHCIYSSEWVGAQNLFVALSSWIIPSQTEGQDIQNIVLWVQVIDGKADRLYTHNIVTGEYMTFQVVDDAWMTSDGVFYGEGMCLFNPEDGSFNCDEPSIVTFLSHTITGDDVDYDYVAW